MAHLAPAGATRWTNLLTGSSHKSHWRSSRRDRAPKSREASLPLSPTFDFDPTYLGWSRWNSLHFLVLGDCCRQLGRLNHESHQTTRVSNDKDKRRTNS